MKIWQRSLRARLILSFLALSLIVASLATTIAYVEAREALTAALYERLGAVATLKEEALSYWIADQQQEVVFMAGLPELQTKLPALIDGSHSEREESDAFLSQFLAAAKDSGDPYQFISRGRLPTS